MGNCSLYEEKENWFINFVYTKLYKGEMLCESKIIKLIEDTGGVKEELYICNLKYNSWQHLKIKNFY